MDFVLDFLDDRPPHQRRNGIFGYGDTQVFEMGPIVAKFYLQGLGVLALQFQPYIQHLSRFSLLPEVRRKRSRERLKFLAIWSEAFPKRMMSSTKRAWLMG